MKALSADSFLARLLGKLAAAVCRHPGWFVWPQVVLFVASIFYTASFLKFDMNRDDLVGSNKKYHQNYLNYKKEFPQQDDLVVVVQSDDIEKNRQFAERVAAKMTAETNLFRSVFFKQDLAMMGDKALLFASTNDLSELDARLRDELPFIQKFTAATNLDSFFDQINTAFRTSPREANAQTKSLAQAIPAVTRIVTQATDSLQRPGTPISPGVTSFFGAGETAASYITFAGGKIFLVTAHAPSDDKNGPAVDRLRQLVNDTKIEVPGVNVGITGEPVLDYDEMTQSQRDTTKASILSLVLCALIFIYGYNETGRPVKATVCLIFGLAYTLAFATLAVGHLNILTITFVPMLIGLAIDFGVHLITRYEEELRLGKTNEAALTKAMVFTGQGIFTGAATTAFAFLAMGLTHFKGIQEMGIICGGGLLVCFVPMMTLLPVLLLRGRQNVIDHKIKEPVQRARIEHLWLQNPGLTIAVTAALCVAAAIGARQVYFDYNLIQMQSQTLPSVIFEQKLIKSADKSLLFGAVIADSLTNAIELEEKMKQLPNVASIQPPESLFNDFLNPDQGEKLKLIGQIKREVSPLEFQPPDLNPVNVSNLSLTLYGTAGYAGQAFNEVRTNDAEMAKQFSDLQQAALGLRKAMLEGDTTTVAAHADKLGQFQRALFGDVRGTFQLLQGQDDSSPPRVEDLPPALRERFVGVTGKFLLQVYPNIDIWERTNQEKFVTELRHALDPSESNHPIITGTPVQLYEYETLLKNSYIQAAWYSLAAIALMVLFHFRSFGAVILSLLPVGIGTLWLAGIMGAFGIPLNLANIMTLPLVIGIGVTNGIHILNRFAEERTPDILARSTGKAVLVSGLTAIAGFGSLIIAKHRGIHSLGCVMSIGIATCMIAGLTFLPALLNLLGRWRPLIKQPSAGKKSADTGSGGTEVKTSRVRID
jgi:hopanoid biosynthesis associated RND transporter like protein HpnN